jgi:hypothetical protein
MTAEREALEAAWAAWNQTASEFVALMAIHGNPGAVQIETWWDPKTRTSIHDGPTRGSLFKMAKRIRTNGWVLQLAGAGPSPTPGVFLVTTGEVFWYYLDNGRVPCLGTWESEQAAALAHGRPAVAVAKSGEELVGRLMEVPGGPQPPRPEGMPDPAGQWAAVLSRLLVEHDLDRPIQAQQSVYARRRRRPGGTPTPRQRRADPRRPSD